MNKQPQNLKSRTKTFALRIIAALLLCLMAKVEARAADNIETAGDILQYVLPATAAGLTLGYKDGKGALQFGESAALTLGVNLRPEIRGQ
jgi:hypothetical protein